MAGRSLVPWRARTPVYRGNPDALSSNALAAAGLSSAALRAAGFRVQQQDSDQLRRIIQPWQSRAFTYYDQLGEIKYASQFYSRMLSPLRLFAAERDENGDWVETDFEPAVNALERIQDPGGGREGLLSAYGRLMFLAGEGYLFCSLDPDTNLEQWEMLSTDELRIQGGTIIRYKAPSLAAEEYHEPNDDDWEPVDDETAIAYRLWKRHPRYSMLSDSTMMGVLDICEELLLLTRAIRARARSRLAGAGILAVSEDFSYAPLEPVGDEDVNEDPFLSDLTAAMVKPITDEGLASAVVPLVIRGSTNAVKDGIRHIQLVDPTQLYPETGLRRELIERIAIGLDMPPEILLGLADSNHWTAWQIDEQTWKGHGQPLADQLVNDLSASYFLPQLRADDVRDWQRYRIAYDATSIINHPDRSADAMKLYDRRAIGKEALRDATNFDEADAPTQEELFEMIGVAIRDGSLALYGEPSIKAGGVEVRPGELLTPDGEQTAPSGPGTGAEVEEGPPASPPNGAVSSAPDLVGAARVAGASDLALRRAREAAGNRLKSLARRKGGEVYALVEDVPAARVAFVLGQERVHALGISEVDLVASARTILTDAFLVWGLKRDVVELLVEQVERHAAKTLYEENVVPLPNQFESFSRGVLGVR